MTSVGGYLPERIVTNEELSTSVDTSDVWIRQRTGIAQRHIVAEGEKTSDLACNAARQALERAGITAEHIDLIVIATSTPDDTFPSTATQVQHMLGAHNAVAFDVQACTSKATALCAPSICCTCVAVDGKVSSGVEVAMTIRSMCSAVMPARSNA